MDSSLWTELWHLLPGFRHVGIDLPGHGRSRPPLPGEDLGDLAARVLSIAADFDAQRLVGISFGGMVALQVAIIAGDALSTVVLGSPALGGGPQDASAQVRNVELARLYAQRGAGPWMTDLWMRSPPAIFDGARRHPQLLAGITRVVNAHRWTELGMHEQSMQRWTTRSQIGLLDRVRAETVVVVGDEDMAAFLRSATLIVRGVSRGRRQYVHGAGHLALLEEPELGAGFVRAAFTATNV
jgi:pimeloyl-ACP methyl ester carboxylesterase